MVHSKGNQVDFSKLRILLIEDDEDDYVLTHALLEDIAKSDVHMDWAPTFEDALRLTESSNYDVCLLDYRLGKTDGLKVLRELRERDFNSPIIMLTGHDNEELDALAINSGATDYLLKSRLDPSQLKRAIRYAVLRNQMETEYLERVRAESENQSKTEFLARLSHELRTPLTAILGYTDIMLMRTEISEDLNQLQIVKRNSKHLLSLLNDVLDLSKVEAGKLDISKSTTNINGFLADLRSLLAVRASEKNIALNFTALTNIPQTIQTDPTRLRQILLNVIGNAIKFTDEGSVEVSIEVIEPKCPKYLEFKITDTGVGLDDDQLDHIFKPFMQGSNAATRQEPGSGLGLAISYQLAKCLDGEITVESQSGKGSIFTVRIACPDMASVSMVPMALEHVHEKPPELAGFRVSGHVLVVDDLSDIRELVGHIISNAGAQVSYAINGREALELIKTQSDNGSPFDLVIMDMQMPEMDGLTATVKLRKAGHRMPIIALTAATLRGEREKCIKAGCSDHLSKPIDSTLLLESVQFHLSDQESNLVESTNLLLLVEDNDDARMATKELLEHLGWEVIAVSSGYEAIDHTSGLQPQVAFIDINLPDINGFDLVDKLRESGLNNTRLIALTGEEIDHDRFKSSGFGAYLQKPITVTELIQALGT